MNGMLRTCRCVECLRDFPESEVIHLGSLSVCAECKPAAVGKIANGKPLGRFGRKRRKLIAIRSGPVIEFPPRCIRCNDPVSAARERSTSLWVNLAAWPPSIVSVAWKFGLCGRHTKRDALGTLIAVGLGISAAAVLFTSALGFLAETAAKPLFTLLVLATISVARLTRYEAKGTRHRREYSAFSGCAAKFLAEFPEWPGTK